MASHAKKPSPKPKPASKPSDIGRVFMHGRSQAVQIPKAFRLPGGKVRVRRKGQALVLEPLDRIKEKPSRSLREFRAAARRLANGVSTSPDGCPQQPPMPEDEENLWDRYWP